MSIVNTTLHDPIARWLLPCGCLVGDYRVRRGARVIMVETVAPDCHAAQHRVHAILSMIGVVAATPSDDSQ